jgi:hypothetical protein
VVLLDLTADIYLVFLRSLHKRAHEGGMRISKKPKKNKIAFDVLNAKELMQKL